MRKLLLCIVVLCFCQTSYGQRIDWPENFLAFCLGWDYPTSVWKDGDKLTLIRRFGFKDYFQNFSLADMKLQSDGFYELSAFGNNLVVLFGAHYFFFHDETRAEYSMFQVSANYNEFYDSFLPFPKRNEERHMGQRRKNINKITVPNVLQETLSGQTIQYDTKDMERYYARGADGIVIVNPNGKPWATGKDPIGMQVDIEFQDVVSISGGLLPKGSDHLVILNGYANPLKRHLYKENRRIKRFRLESLDHDSRFSLEMELKDVVRFHLVRFPKAAEKVRLTILEYYEGTKYRDLCVQAFLADYDMKLPDGNDFIRDAIPWKP